MDITMIGLQNAGKTSLLRVLAVSLCPLRLCVYYVRKVDGVVVLTVWTGRRIYDRVRSELAYRVDDRCTNCFGCMGISVAQETNCASVNIVQYLLLVST
jgi:hypothetical protein